MRSSRGSWVRPRDLSWSEIEAGQFVGFDGRRQRIYRDDELALLDHQAREVGGEVVRLDPSPSQDEARRAGL